MFSRALRLSRAAPLRIRAPLPAVVARRSVTTNAASASVEGSVPKVSTDIAVFFVLAQLTSATPDTGVAGQEESLRPGLGKH